jgi:S-adenosylmethionine hydrolase
VGGDPPGSWEILLPGRNHALLREYYAAVPPGEPLVVRGSAGWLEIAINAGSAAERLGLTAGAPVRLKRVSPPGQARPRRG